MSGQYVLCHRHIAASEWTRTRFTTDDLAAARKERDKRDARYHDLVYSVRDSGNIRIGHDIFTRDPRGNVTLDAATLRELAAWVRRCVPQIEHPSDPDRAILRTILAKIEG
jgi:hypothetical protein